MATAEEHKQQALHNERFLATIDRDEYPDWAATVIFYAAVHRVQMLFETCGGVGGNHHQRNKTLRKLYLGVWKNYQPLYTFSRLSRYWCMKTKPEHIPYILRRYDRVVRAIDDLMP